MKDLRESLKVKKIYDNYGEKIYHYLTIKLGSSSDAEDVLQETFYRLVRYSFRLRFVKNSGAFVFKIARNEAFRFIKNKIEELVDEMWIDPLGSLLAVKNGSNTKERILLDAHADEIGFMVSYVEPKGGFLRFVPIGGWDTRILLGQSVKILGKNNQEYHGIIGSKPPHLTSAKERKAAVDIPKMYIDTGMTTKQVEKAGIQIGSVGTLYHPFVEFPNNMIRGKAFDDRTGINMLIQIIKEFSKKHPTWIFPGLNININVELQKKLRRFGVKGPLWEHMKIGKRLVYKILPAKIH